MDILIACGWLEPDVEMFTHLYAMQFCINPLNNLHLFSWLTLHTIFCTAENLQLCYTNHPVVIIGIVSIIGGVVGRC